ncbi:MAG TPA: hypothetical protein VMW27_08580, partial [Thermoanaerobaculia bacterium]|nr:hypothetical protein [Thermoanaerobaculia bacterium]
SGMKVTNEKGETATFEAGGTPDVPSWVPSYPGSTTQGAFSNKTDTENTLAYTVTTKDPIGDVITFYKEKLQAQGFKVDENTYSTNGKIAGGVMTATSGDEKRQVTFMIGEASEGGTSLTVNASEKK